MLTYLSTLSSYGYQIRDRAHHSSFLPSPSSPRGLVGTRREKGKFEQPEDLSIFRVRREVYDVGMTGAKAQGNILMNGERVTINQR